MRKISGWFTLVMLITGVFVAASPAAEIILKNGRSFNGKIIEQNNDAISFEMNVDSILIPAIINKKDIVSVEFDNTESQDDTNLFNLQQQAKGLVLYQGRWLPKKHVGLLVDRKAKLDKMKKITLFSIQVIIFLMICLAIVMGLDFFYFKLNKYRIKKVSQRHKDDRLHQRIAITVPFIILLNDGTKFSAETSNISLGGLLFYTDKDIRIGTQVRLMLILPECNTPVKIKALVVRVEKDVKTQKNSIGVSFVGLHSGRQQIAQLIAQSRVPVSPEIPEEENQDKK